MGGIPLLCVLPAEQKEQLEERLKGDLENLVILLFIMLLSAHKHWATQLLNFICNEASKICLHNLDLTGAHRSLIL